MIGAFTRILFWIPIEGPKPLLGGNLPGMYGGWFCLDSKTGNSTSRQEAVRMRHSKRPVGFFFGKKCT
jgi:hypothetical protein